MVKEHEDRSVNVACAMLSVLIACLCSLIYLTYFIKHLNGLRAGALRRMSEDSMEFGIIGVVFLLPMTALGLILAVCGGKRRKAALAAQGISLALGAGLLMFQQFSR